MSIGSSGVKGVDARCAVRVVEAVGCRQGYLGLIFYGFVG